MRFLPSVLKELLKHVPTVIFEVVDWSVLGHELPKMTRRLLQAEEENKIFKDQKVFLEPFGIILDQSTRKNFDLKDQKLAAEKILTLYFAQLFSPYGLYLDFGPHHFEFKIDQLHFKTSGLWTKFSPNFSQGLQKIYDGFYFENESLFQQGLLHSGLTSPHWTQEDRNELANLFRSHFGSSLTQGMKFELDPFKESFLKIANFMLTKKVQISVDFLYLGIALVTLYSSLEKSNVHLNVKEIYFKVKEISKLPQS